MLTLELDERLCAVAGTGRIVRNDNPERVTFGRSEKCTVVFPASETGLGREHFELRKAASGYEVVTDSEHPVYTGGKRVVGTEFLPPNAELRLLDPTNGPRIKVMFDKTADGGATDKNALIQQENLRQRMDARVKMGAAVLALLVVAVGGFEGWNWWTWNQNISAVQNQLADIQKAADAAEHNGENGWEDVIKKAEPAVYQVAVQREDGAAQLLATAWAIDGQHLVTNAHVAQYLSHIDPSLTPVIITSSSDRKKIELDRSKITFHPAYGAFVSTLQKTSGLANAILAKNLGITSSYDLALLTVADGVTLPAHLDIATDDPEAGEAIGVIGFPQEGAINTEVVQFKQGVITAVTDFAGLNTAGRHELVYHSAAEVGGASGSPMLNKDGKVVAVFSGGEVVLTTEEQQGTNGAAPTKEEFAAAACLNDYNTNGDCVHRRNSGSGTFYAQSAHLIADMLNADYATKVLPGLEREWETAALYKQSAHRNQVWATIASYSGKSDDVAFLDKPALQATAAFSGGKKGIEVESGNLAAGDYVAFVTANTDPALKLQMRSGDIAVESNLSINGNPVLVFRQKDAGQVNFALTGAAGTQATLMVLPLAQE